MFAIGAIFAWRGGVAAFEQVFSNTSVAACTLLAAAQTLYVIEAHRINGMTQIANRETKQARDHGGVVRVRDQILTVRESEKIGGSNDCRPIFPILGWPALVISAKDEFLNYQNERIAQGSGKEPELPSPSRHVEERLAPGCHDAQRMNSVNQGVDQHRPLRQGSGCKGS